MSTSFDPHMLLFLGIMAALFIALAKHNGKDTK
jgi:hypothetical protein